ncbi:hypothetical protein MRX96_014345 [Rhipicephalus microplus]
MSERFLEGTRYLETGSSPIITLKTGNKIAPWRTEKEQKALPVVAGDSGACIPPRARAQIGIASKAGIRSAAAISAARGSRRPYLADMEGGQGNLLLCGKAPKATVPEIRRSLP